MYLYRLDASIRVEGSHSRAIADIVEQEWRNAHPWPTSSSRPMRCCLPSQPVLRQMPGLPGDAFDLLVRTLARASTVWCGSA